MAVREHRWAVGKSSRLHGGSYTVHDRPWIFDLGWRWRGWEPRWILVRMLEKPGNSPSSLRLKPGESHLTGFTLTVTSSRERHWNPFGRRELRIRRRKELNLWGNLLKAFAHSTTLPDRDGMNVYQLARLHRTVPPLLRSLVRTGIRVRAKRPSHEVDRVECAGCIPIQQTGLETKILLPVRVLRR